MTILMVNKFHYLRGGAERYYFDLMALLERHGHRVIPFSTSDPRNLTSEHAADFAPGTDFERPVGPIESLRRAIQVVYSPAARQAFARALARHRPDVVHLHNFAHHLSPSILDEIGKTGTPAVQTLHDFKLLCPTYLMLRNGEVCELCAGGNVAHVVIHRCNRGSLAMSTVNALETLVAAGRHSYDHVRRFLCPSRFLRDKLQAYGFLAERLVHLPLFLDLARFTPRDGGGDGGYAIFVGRLSSEKGIATLLDAAARLREVPLVVVGEGQLAPAIAAECASRGLTHVRLAGRLEGEALLDLWHGARFTVVPSQCYENFPLVVVEAFALGQPVIASGLGGLAELVDPGRTGMLVPPGDAAALAEAMRQLYLEPARARAMGEEARAEVAARYTPAMHLERLLEAYAAAGAPAR
jgi:glycosyltransferase involved in cell wall biosynthesis